MKAMLKMALYAAVGILALGCAGGDDDDDDDAVGAFVITDLGGYVVIAGGPSGYFAVAEFYSDIQPAQNINYPGATDNCVENPPPPAGPPTPSYVDVGTEVTFTNGATTLTLPRFDQNPPTIAYALNDTTGIPTGTYDVAIAGEGAIPAGTIGTIHLPSAASGTLANTLMPGDPLDVTWTGGADAAVILIDLLASGSTLSYTCFARPDGAFTVPGSVTMAVGSGATVNVNAYSLASIAFEGRHVLSQGLGSQ